MPGAAPDAAALRAATLSFASSNSASPSPSRARPQSTTAAAAIAVAATTTTATTTAKARSHSRSSSTASGRLNNDRLLSPPRRHTGRADQNGDAQWAAARTRSTSTNRSTSPTKSSSRLSQQSTSSVAANLAFARSPAASPRPLPMAEDALPASGTVLSRRKLFLEGGGVGDGGKDDSKHDLSSGPPPVRQISPERKSRPGSPSKEAQEGVDSASVEDIAALRSMFERGRKPVQSPSIHAPKPIPVHKQQSASVTAAVLATQLSPPTSVTTSRFASPERSPPSSPTRSAGSQAPRKLVPPPVKKKPAIAIAALQSKAQGPPTPVLSAAHAAVQSTAVAPSTPPKPPPPRKIRALEPSPQITSSPASSAPSIYETPESTPTKPPAPPPPRLSGAARESTAAQSTTKPEPAPSTTKTPVPPVPPPPSTKSSAPATSSSKPPAPPPRTTPSAASSQQAPPPASSSPPPPPLPRRTTFPNNPSPNNASVPGPSTSAPVTKTHTGSSSHSGSVSATIAASLAPSRTVTPGPRKQPAPAPPPARRQPKPSQSPTKHLRATLRDDGKPERSSTPPPSHRNKLTHRHHAEAKNPAYRAAISERQRKRYEGLWAANRGLLGVDNDAVHGYVVRDIWGRSRLGKRVLAEIWEAVDRGSKGWLDREEMVVGTWLVDQSLRGRKVPVKVQESVWDSVRRVSRSRS